MASTMEMTKPARPRRTVTLSEVQKPGSRKTWPVATRVLTGDGTICSDLLSSDTTSHTSRRKAMPAKLMSLFFVIKFFIRHAAAKD